MKCRKIKFVICISCVIFTFFTLFSKILNTKNEKEHPVTKPTLYIITPTYKKPTQIPELIRMGNTLKHLDDLIWLVVEDAEVLSDKVSETLIRLGVKFEHLLAPYPTSENIQNKTKAKGVSNRNRGLQWIKEHATSGVFYFGDDDNTYDPRLLEEIRYTKKVSFFPTGLITQTGVSSAYLRNGVFEEFYDEYRRNYSVDMASFAVGVEFYKSRPKAYMSYTICMEETLFLEALEPFDMNTDVQFLANNCTDILVWHTTTLKFNDLQNVDVARYNGTNVAQLQDYILNRDFP